MELLDIIPMGMHQASAIIFPIIVPMHESYTSEGLICTKINATTTICNSPPPTQDQVYLEYFGFGVIICAAISMYVSVWKFWY